jgi:hypothetical protein
LSQRISQPLKDNGREAEQKGKIIKFPNGSMKSSA